MADVPMFWLRCLAAELVSGGSQGDAPGGVGDLSNIGSAAKSAR